MEAQQFMQAMSGSRIRAGPGMHYFTQRTENPVDFAHISL
jgi:hypothetical protein